MKRAIILSIGVAAFVAGCSNQPSPKIVIPPKWQGAAYHLSFGATPAKPNAAGLTIPQIKYVADPDAIETRADLVIEFDSSVVKTKAPVMDQMAMAAVTISGSEGALPDDYVAKASTDLSEMLAAYCVRGKVKILRGADALVAAHEPERRPDQREAPLRLDADCTRLQKPAPEVLSDSCQLLVVSCP